MGDLVTFEKAFKERFDQVTIGLKDESDRAKVIIVAAHLDQLLDEMLRLALVPCSSSNDPLFDGPNAPLANFSNRIDLSYRLGLISEFAAKSLHLIRKIRNNFAHGITGCSFDDQSIKSRIEELYRLHRIDDKHTELKDSFPDSIKGRFIMSVIMLIGVIQETSHLVKPRQQKQPEWLYDWQL